MVERRQIVGLERMRRLLGVGTGFLCLCLAFDFIEYILYDTRTNKLSLSVWFYVDIALQRQTHSRRIPKVPPLALQDLS